MQQLDGMKERLGSAKVLVGTRQSNLKNIVSSEGSLSKSMYENVQTQEMF